MQLTGNNWEKLTEMQLVTPKAMSSACLLVLLMVMPMVLMSVMLMVLTTEMN